ncbi:MAG: hypothetical protein RLY93_10880 [Sumerlaeia bacterium]
MNEGIVQHPDEARERFEELLDDYAFGTLSEDERAEFEALMAANEEWRPEADGHARIVSAIRSAPRPAAPQGLLAGALAKAREPEMIPTRKSPAASAKIEDITPRRGRAWIWAAAAAVLFLGVGITAWQANLEEPSATSRDGGVSALDERVLTDATAPSGRTRQDAPAPDPAGEMEIASLPREETSDEDASDMVASAMDLRASKSAAGSRMRTALAPLESDAPATVAMEESEVVWNDETMELAQEPAPVEHLAEDKEERGMIARAAVPMSEGFASPANEERSAPPSFGEERAMSAFASQTTSSFASGPSRSMAGARLGHEEDADPLSRDDVAFLVARALPLGGRLVVPDGPAMAPAFAATSLRMQDGASRDAKLASPAFRTARGNALVPGMGSFAREDSTTMSTLASEPVTRVPVDPETLAFDFEEKAALEAFLQSLRPETAKDRRAMQPRDNTVGSARRSLASQAAAALAKPDESAPRFRVQIMPNPNGAEGYRVLLSKSPAAEE